MVGMNWKWYRRDQATAVVASLSARRLRFCLKPVHVAGKVLLGQVFLRALRASPVNLFPTELHTQSFIYHRCCITIAVDGASKLNSKELESMNGSNYDPSSDTGIFLGSRLMTHKGKF
jgi:hypothetical protein